MAAESDFSLVEVQTIKGMRRSPASRSTCNHAVMLVAEVADIHARGAAAATLLGHLNINIQVRIRRSLSRASYRRPPQDGRTQAWSAALPRVPHDRAGHPVAVVALLYSVPHLGRGPYD
jgi:hypothetical protein